MKDVENIEDIKIFVDSFYSKVRANELIGPVFSLRIQGNDWSGHLNRMYGFWNTVLFGGKTYKGNPFSKHADLPITPLHFETWVTLFKATMDEHFEGPVAAGAKLRADHMATLFISKLAHNRNNPSYRSII